jgi:biopolymer transport protein ExbD
MAMSTSTSDDAAPYINITPLIDILLVLLIIFMVISPLKPTRFEAKVPAEPDENEQTIAKPNPYTLLVEVGNDQKVRLNREDMGTITDPSALGTRLSGVFKDRESQGVYRTGSTTEIEKTVFIKAPKTLRYGDVVRVIDTVKGSGASPIGLQVDDLTQ